MFKKHSKTLKVLSVLEELHINHIRWKNIRLSKNKKVGWGEGGGCFTLQMTQLMRVLKKYCVRCSEEIPLTYYVLHGLLIVVDPVKLIHGLYIP